MFSRANGGTAMVITLMSALLIPVFCFGADNGDTALHVGISSLFGAAGETYFHYKTDLEAPGRVLLGTFVGSLPGLAKELTDSRFSGSDMAADVAGAFLGALVANFVNNRLKVNVERQARKTSVRLTYSF
jgi:VanZ family protein